MIMDYYRIAMRLTLFLVMPFSASSLKICRSSSHEYRLCSTKEVSDSVRESGAATVLKCDRMSKSFTGQAQFEEISFSLGRGQRVGLIGVNGVGKSTFLRCLAGVDRPDSGSVEAAAACHVVFVEQDPQWGDGVPVYEVLFGTGSPPARATALYSAALRQSEAGDDSALGPAVEAMTEADAWDYQERGLELAQRLQIGPADLYRPVGGLSGGQKKRVALAAALLLAPDVLLLDEPTNHLDIDALDWLGEYLRPGGGAGRDMSVLLVTHDRHFLERACSEMELDRGALYRYPCSYAQYLEQKAARLAAEDAETQRVRTRLRRESEWMARQPKARQAKSRAREAAYYSLLDRARGRAPDTKALELATPEERARQQRLGGVVAQFEAACYSAGGAALLRDFTYDFRQRDRIGVVGPNGVGKSTFLRLLAGQLQLQSGSMRLGDTARVGYYAQGGLLLTAEQERLPVLQFVQEACERAADRSLESVAPRVTVAVEDEASMGRRRRVAGNEAAVTVEVTEATSAPRAFSEREAMSLLSRFQFPSRRWYDRVGQLSGGERRRLQLLQVMAGRPNVLLLDEPSNDLDLSTVAALEDYLCESFAGCLVAVSHDNFFVNRVAEHLFVFTGDGVVGDFKGSYSEYLEHRAGLAADLRGREKDRKVDRREDKSTSISPQSKAGSAAPLSFSERKELAKLEREVGRCAALLQEAEAALKTLSTSSGKNKDKDRKEAALRAAAARTQLEQTEARWLELAAREEATVE